MRNFFPLICSYMRNATWMSFSPSISWASAFLSLSLFLDGFTATASSTASLPMFLLPSQSSLCTVRVCFWKWNSHSVNPQLKSYSFILHKKCSHFLSRLEDHFEPIPFSLSLYFLTCYFSAPGRPNYLEFFRYISAFSLLNHFISYTWYIILGSLKCTLLPLHLCGIMPSDPFRFTCCVRSSSAWFHGGPILHTMPSYHGRLLLTRLPP